MSLLKTSKEQFKMMRENDWESLLEEVSSFFIKIDIDIDILDMDDEYKLRGCSRRKSQGLPTYTISIMNCLTISLTCNLLSWMIVLLRRVRILKQSVNSSHTTARSLNACIQVSTYHKRVAGPPYWLPHLNPPLSIKEKVGYISESILEFWRSYSCQRQTQSIKNINQRWNFLTS